MKKKEKTNFETNMKELEQIVQKMSKNTLPLDESVQLFEKGMSISKACSLELNKAQQKVQKIINSNTEEDLELEDFDLSEDDD